MDNYIVSARKYRPSTFHTVIGQSALTTTLKNAISTNKLAHAYLFCGPRGVGKTTCARIFAKAINCFHPTADGEACNECESCRSFNEKRSYNIYELDAASNNSVDDIRTLIQQVRIPPQLGKYKVYIIDEVHMLTQQAFNAFLKTLEEPPLHAIFILATTEKHKVLSTILSRCQVYDFNRISNNDIINYLEYVAEQENVNAEREALTVIAQKADGGMRDALSIFDQVVSFSQGNVSYKTVIENLNVLDYEYYFRLIDAVLQNKLGQSMLLLNEILNKGFDGQQILSGLSLFFRDLLVCKDPQTIVLFEVGDTVKNKYIESAARCSALFLYKAIDLTVETDLNYRVSRNKRLFIELLLIRLCQLSSPQSEDDKKKMLIEPITENPAPTQNESIPQKEIPATPVNQPVAPRKAVVRIGLKDANAQKPESKENQGNDNQVIFDEPFTQEDLTVAWKKYAGSVEDVYLKNTMLYIIPELKGNSRITISVLNPEQANTFKEKIPEIKKFLFDQLKNNQIEMELLICESESNHKPFTDREKYDYMVDKNPHLNKLVKEFNLRLD
jgi:DNA polymerase-3 subunit gamma/tau